MGAEAGVVLVVVPDTGEREQLAALISERGARVVTSAGAEQALELLNSQPAEIVVMALDLPDMDGLELLAIVEDRWPGLPILVIAEEPSAPMTLTALKAGAADIVEKPFGAEQISFVLGKARAAVTSFAVRPPPPPSSAKAGILGDSAAMQQAYGTIQRAAQGTATVLIRGESGTGKELVARAIHRGSPRAEQPFVKIDCASLPENLLESELFGYEKGAFTGAVSRKLGRVELADKGTLFLDEIGELTLPLQAKLLRLLQERQFERLGGTKTIQIDIRVLAATHRDLDLMIEREQFRLDLFYRLNVIPLWLPPLRARREDIPVLATHFCKSFGTANGRPDITIDGAAMRALRGQRWPGNVRQLQNFIERLVVLSPGAVIGEVEVRAELERGMTFHTEPVSAAVIEAVAAAAPSDAPADAPSVLLTLSTEMKAAEKKALERALKHCKGNRSLVARLLNVSRSTLYNKLQEHGLL
jgi:two-component system response regulator AtoC